MKAELTLDSIKVGNDVVNWNDTLKDVNSKFYKDTSNEFKKLIMLIYDETGLPYSSIEVTALNPKVTRFRSVRAGEPIVAEYDAHLIVDLLEVPSDATNSQIEEQVKGIVETKVNSAVDKLTNDGTLDGAQSSMKSVVSIISDANTNKGGLSDGELAGIIIGSVMGAILLILVAGFFIMRSMKEPEPVDIEIREPNKKNSSNLYTSSSLQVGNESEIEPIFTTGVTASGLDESFLKPALQPPVQMSTRLTSFHEVCFLVFFCVG